MRRGPTMIETAPESPPAVLGTAARLKRAARHPRLGRVLRRMRGAAALRSDSDRQSVTIRFECGRVRLSSGVARDARVVVTLDWNDPAVAPKARGVLRHPVFALRLSRVLDPPLGSWQEEARAFWDFASTWPRMPRSMRVVCTDDGSELHLGEPGEAEYEVEGSRQALLSAFSGNSVLVQDALDGKLRIAGTYEHSSILAGRAIAWVMGEGR